MNSFVPDNPFLKSGAPELDERSRDIFTQIVDAYLESGEPLGSRTLSRRLSMALSPASVRNVMSDLERLGLIYAPHTSAGRLPTEAGLRFFVDTLLEFGDLSLAERKDIDAQLAGPSDNQGLESVLTDAVQMLSGMSKGAGVVLASKAEKPLKHIEFVRLEPSKSLVILVGADGTVENRVFDVDTGLPTSALTEAGNYLNARIQGLTLSEARAMLVEEYDAERVELDELARKVVDAGFATWTPDDGNGNETLIVRGTANLLDDASAQNNIERIRILFEDIERKKDLAQLLGSSEKADGVRIFIGSENKLFSLSGSSVVAAPFRDTEQNIIGAVGVIGPTRLNYARIVPMVDYTARLVSRLINR